jgi:hypothetical protein
VHLLVALDIARFTPLTIQNVRIGAVYDTLVLSKAPKETQEIVEENGIEG